jgi:hypothetical protein
VRRTSISSDVFIASLSPSSHRVGLCNVCRINPIQVRLAIDAAMNSSFQLPLLDAPAAGCRHRGLVSCLLDEAQARGRLVVSVDELVASSKLTPLAVKRQLEHVAERVTRLPGRPSSYLIVPPEHRARGAPPMDSWLGDYFRLREQPYYLGLLSAAAMHGSSHQAVQVTQVMTLPPMRPMQVGRLLIQFHVKASLERTPLTELGGACCAFGSQQSGGHRLGSGGVQSMHRWY